jgi:aminoglycoside 6'-N-acetyltransferase
LSSLSFRALGRSDFPPLQKWLAAPHVSAWWNDPSDPESLEAHYGPPIDGREPVYVFVIQHDGVSIGWIQWYRWRDFPEHAAQVGGDPQSAGIDLAIGDVEMTGRGLGPAIIRDFGTRYIFSNDDVCAIVADPSADNARSIRAFRKAGFEVVRTVRLSGETFDRHIVRLGRAVSP